MCVCFFFSEHCFNIVFLIHIFRNMFNYLVSFPFSMFLVSLELLLLVELHAPDWRFSICLRIVLVVFSDACSFAAVFWLRSRTAWLTCTAGTVCLSLSRSFWQRKRQNGFRGLQKIASVTSWGPLPLHGEAVLLVLWRWRHQRSLRRRGVDVADAMDVEALAALAHQYGDAGLGPGLAGHRPGLPLRRRSRAALLRMVGKKQERPWHWWPTAQMRPLAWFQLWSTKAMVVDLAVLLGMFDRRPIGRCCHCVFQEHSPCMVIDDLGFAGP